MTALSVCDSTKMAVYSFTENYGQICRASQATQFCQEMCGFQEECEQIIQFSMLEERLPTSVLQCNNVRYDNLYLTCSHKLTNSQLSLE